MNKRPTSVTVIAWLLIVLGGISILTTTAAINNPAVLEVMGRSPLPIGVQFAMTYAGLVIMIVCGVAMLKGRNWGRLLYVIWTGAGFVIGIFTSPVKGAMIPGLVVFIIACFFLFRPKANQYFAAPDPPGGPQDT
jgi:hypothetical protein